ncbi:DUF1674 domain-containing protein [Sphingomonas sp.]|uniref:DUF1674 domain-containing protein n=1 Tax=Sphingomonas sp. TaxID=28214 RepID=UPI003AFFED87
MTSEPSRRPASSTPPAHLSPSPPLPQPSSDLDPARGETADRPAPTRYGDWELKGIAVDF